MLPGRAAEEAALRGTVGRKAARKTPVRWTCGGCVARRDAQPAPQHANREVRPAGDITLRAMRAVHPEPGDVDGEAGTGDDILSLRLEERVRLEFFRGDGWWYGTSLATHQAGWFPSAYVDYLPGFKLDCTRCCECFVANPRFPRKLPGICLAADGAAASSTTPATAKPPNYDNHASINKIPTFPTKGAAATALATTTNDAIVSLRPMSSPLKVQSHYGRMCENLEILSLSPLLLRLDGFLSPEVCRKLIASAYERGFSKEESGCHGDGDEHSNHHHQVLLADKGHESKTMASSCPRNHSDHNNISNNSADNSYPTEAPPSACTDANSRNNAQRTSTACWLREYDFETAVSSCAEPQGLAYENRSAFVDTEDKIAALSGMPKHHQEPLQVVRYFPGQQFVPHMDWIDEYTQEEYGGRVITVLIYLQACKEGGSTSFPTLGKTVPPVRGTALFWYNCHPTDDVRNNVTVDERLLHAGEPVLAGEKIVAVTWVHPFSATKIRDS